MSLQISEKCCTFEVDKWFGKNPDFNFFKDKAQATGESPANLRYPDCLSNDLSLYTQL